MPVYRRLLIQALEASHAGTACQLAREMVQAGMTPPASALEAIVFVAGQEMPMLHPSTALSAAPQPQRHSRGHRSQQQHAHQPSQPTHHCQQQQRQPRAVRHPSFS